MTALQFVWSAFTWPALQITVVLCTLVGIYDFGARKGWWPA